MLHVQLHWTTTKKTVIGLIFRFAIPNLIRISHLVISLIIHNFTQFLWRGRTVCCCNYSLVTEICSMANVPAPQYKPISVMNSRVPHMSEIQCLGKYCMVTFKMFMMSHSIAVGHIAPKDSPPVCNLHVVNHLSGWSAAYRHICPFAQ